MNYTVIDFTNVCKFIVCCSENEFVEMYNNIGFANINYARVKYIMACKNFITWWCELDTNTQNNVINYIKKFYEKNN